MPGEHLPRAYRVVQVFEENEDAKTWVLDGRLEATPGQFVMVWLPGIDEKPFSLVDADPIALTVARVGPFTTALHQVKKEERIWLRGPFGKGFTAGAGPALLVAGGYGSAPLAFLARQLRALGQAIHVVLGAHTAKSLLLQRCFVEQGCTLHLATEDASAGDRGLATDVAADLLHRHRFGTLYGCGPNPMLDALAALARAQGLPCQLSYEAYIRCGIGVCGSCTHGDRLVCRDGPVFEA